MRKRLYPIALLLLFLSLTSFSLGRLHNLHESLAAERKLDPDQTREVLYLPSGVGLKALSFGYRNFLSDILWFNTISYFGKHYGSDRNYKWFSHMCDLVSTLDPRAHHVYKFCSMMLAWEAGLPEKGIEILTRAIANHPDDWNYYYLRGFNQMFFLENDEEAAKDLTKAASFSDAPVVVKRLGAMKMARSDPDMAVRFLEGMIKEATDPNERKALIDRYKEAVFESTIRKLEHALQVYRQRTGRSAMSLEDLKQAGIIGGDLHDPFGGRYLLDPESGQIKSSTGKKRLKLYKKKTIND